MEKKEIIRTFSGTSWEEKASYCRALRVGNQIYVSGTAPIDLEAYSPPEMLTPKLNIACQLSKKLCRIWGLTVAMLSGYACL